MADCDFRIEIQVEEAQPININRDGAFRMRISVVDTVNVVPEVFLFRRMPPDPYTSEEADEFITVCSPADLTEYPVSAPAIDNNLPYFRLSSIDLLYRSTTDFENAYNQIVAALGVLTESLCRLESMVVTRRFWIPDPPPGSGSSSSSGSSSTSGP